MILPKDIAKLVPSDRLMTETEWRNLGVQQSRGWVHYMIHRPGEAWVLGDPLAMEADGGGVPAMPTLF